MAHGEKVNSISGQTDSAACGWCCEIAGCMVVADDRRMVFKRNSGLKLSMHVYNFEFVNEIRIEVGRLTVLHAVVVRLQDAWSPSDGDAVFIQSTYCEFV